MYAFQEVIRHVKEGFDQLKHDIDYQNLNYDQSRRFEKLRALSSHLELKFDEFVNQKADHSDALAVFDLLHHDPVQFAQQVTRVPINIFLVSAIF